MAPEHPSTRRERLVGVLVMPNVGANRPAEADGVSPDCDDSTTGAGWAYDGCRSGSG